MEKITVSERKDLPYMTYLYGKMTDKCAYMPFGVKMHGEGERSEIVFDADKKYFPYIRRIAEEEIADVIVIGYKYRYFKDMLCLPLLNDDEKEILLCSIVAADFAEDYEYAKHKIRSQGNYCIDGIFHFRLSELKNRWKKISEYIPTEFSSSTLESFVDFIIGEGSGKAFLKEGVLYDEEYMPIRRCGILGEESIEKEILLSGAANVYCFGKLDARVERFLKKYYKEKAVFC